MADDISVANQRHWERMVKEGCGFTRPWLDLDAATLRRYANGELVHVPYPLPEIYPPSLLRAVAGRDVLCLASGGGQQSAVFGLLGARVTVVDLVQGQLDGDRQAAAHYGYSLTAVQADMRDLSMLAGGSFDLVYQAPSISYVADVRPVFSEVARVLRPGGTYRAEFSNPATQFVDPEAWDGQGYRISVPYVMRHIAQPGREAMDFRHTLPDIFNGLIQAGFAVRGVYDSPSHLVEDVSPTPGSWEHWLQIVHGLFAVVALRG